jgi:deoxycytidylate deaminase
MRLLIQAGVERVVWDGSYPDEETVKVAKESGFETRNGEIRRMV